jgi:hypothetical protein
LPGGSRAPGAIHPGGRRATGPVPPSRRRAARHVLARPRRLWHRCARGTAVGLLGVSLAFGLTVLTGAYALGHVSGGHFNPAVTIGQVVTRRFPARDALPYVIAQVLGAVIAAAVLLVIADGHPGFSADGNFLAANGFGSDGSPEPTACSPPWSPRSS